jgi:hypothetical protein
LSLTPSAISFILFHEVSTLSSKAFCNIILDCASADLKLSFIINQSDIQSSLSSASIFSILGNATESNDTSLPFTLIDSISQDDIAVQAHQVQVCHNVFFVEALLFSIPALISSNSNWNFSSSLALSSHLSFSTLLAFNTILAITHSSIQDDLAKDCT